MTGISEIPIKAKIVVNQDYLDGMTAAYDDMHSAAVKSANKYPEYDFKHMVYSSLAKDIKQRSTIVSQTILEILK